jgi:GNAT superfamily N-acetyltransferase
MTTCLMESKKLLERAMRTRGLSPVIEGRTFSVQMQETAWHQERPYVVGRWSMSFLPGNRRILVCHDVFVETKFRNQGLGRKWLQLREELALEAGCNLLQATVRDDNAVEIHLLQSFKWRRLIDRRETGVSLWTKRLKAPKGA